MGDVRTTYTVALGPECFRTSDCHVAESFSRVGAAVTAITDGDG